MKKLRKRKVYQKHQARELRYIAVPEIRLEGKWLEELGFDIGNEIDIEEQRHKLVITLAGKKKGKN
ncbi:MAG: SymE family type I addiction module toxin [Bacteroidota bacterium]